MRLLLLFFVVFDLTSAQLTKLVQLATISLSEETRELPQKLFDFTDLFQTDSNLHRLQLISGDDKQQTRADNNERNYYLIESMLFTNLTYDREKMFAEKQCLPSFQQPATMSTNNGDDCLIKLRIAGYDENNNLIKIFTLPILILDINDNQPEFKHLIYKLNISENLSGQTLIPLESPIDLDSSKFGVQQCHLNNNFNRLFQVEFNKESQRLNLLINLALDREERSSYELSLICTDSIGLANTKIYIDVLDSNDNSPIFNQQTKTPITIEEFDGFNEGEIDLVKIEADDKDDSNTPNGQVFYSLPSELNYFEKGLFTIDEQTGVIKIERDSKLDYETRKEYWLKVKAQDKGPNSIPTYADISVKVLDRNDNAPNGHLTFVEKYLLKQNEANNTIWINEEIDFAKSVTLAYLTVNDADTFVSNGNGSLRAYIHSVSTTTQNSSTNIFQLEQIVQDQDSLYYSLQLIGRLDREKVDSYDLTIKLEDNFNNSDNFKLSSEIQLRIILVDINDNKPKFKQWPSYTMLVDENVAAANFGQVSAEDPDLGLNGAVSYEILEASSLFRVDSESGVLSLRAPLDREVKEKHTFTVRASDKSLSNKLSSECKVNVIVLDKNDNAPKFNQAKFEFELDENVRVGSLVGNVKANDLDLHASTAYEITPFNYAKYFRVDNRTGDLLSNFELDAENVELVALLSNDTFRFELSAVDLDSAESGGRVEVEVRLNDVNDNAPEILVEKKILELNLMNASCEGGESVVVVERLKWVEKDRDAVRKFSNESIKLNSFRINSIRRLSWPLVYEILRKNGNLNQSLNGTIKFLDSILDSTKLKTLASSSLPTLPKVNLRQIFTLEQREVELLNKTIVNSVDLMINQICRLNLGVYTINISAIDNENSSLQNHVTLRLFVYDSNEGGLNETGLVVLHELVETWWLQNSAYVSGMKKYKSSNSNKQLLLMPDDNGDDLDSLTQDYYNFYAASVFSRDLNLDLNTLVSIKHFFMANSSRALILLIGFFALISIGLVALITYKYTKASGAISGRKKRPKSGSGSSSAVITARSSLSASRDATLAGSDNSIKINKQKIQLEEKEEAISESQSTKELSSSPNHRSSVCFTQKSSNKDSILLNFNNQHQTRQHQQLIAKVNNNLNNSINNNSLATSEQIKRYMQCLEENENPSNSICDSFTIITSLAGADCSSLMMQNQGQGFLSTFVSGANTQQRLVEEDEINSMIDSPPITNPASNANNVNTVNTDLGYYGSSDYSDNNSFGVCAKQIIKQPQQQQQQQQQTRIKYVQNSNVKQSNNNLSLNSSSLLSSPISSSSSTEASTSPLFHNPKSATSSCNQNPTPIITNLYPFNYFKATTKQSTDSYHKIDELANAQSVSEMKNRNSSTNPDVKLYLERFERIYNSNESDSVEQQQAKNARIASLTTYSYV